MSKLNIELCLYFIHVKKTCMSEQKKEERLTVSYNQEKKKSFFIFSIVPSVSLRCWQIWISRRRHTRCCIIYLTNRSPSKTSNTLASDVKCSKIAAAFNPFYKSKHKIRSSDICYKEDRAVSNVLEQQTKKKRRIIILLWSSAEFVKVSKSLHSVESSWYFALFVLSFHLVPYYLVLFC